MRRKVTPKIIRQFMEELAAAAQSPGKVYLTGGATALLLGFRDQTIDIDVKFDPEPKGVFEAIAALKNRLDVNVELASPDDFIPAAPDWRECSPHIASIGKLEFFHYDLSMQALAKIERGHTQDIKDVLSLVRGGYVKPGAIEKRFGQIEPLLLRYPAVDAQEFKEKVKSFLKRTRNDAD